jgi:sensor c-di-GMP phosphodiesterase-like protein
MMCEGLNLKVIAEGIETEEQALNAPGHSAASPARAGFYGKAVDAATDLPP